jgi:hypothetical protein
MRGVLALFAAAAAALFVVPQALAVGVTHWVNDDAATYAPPGTSCTNAGYSTIQSAVTAATAGDTINVCPGTYPEQVSVETPAKSNLVIRSVVPLAATIKAPPVMELVHGDLVRIDQGARNVTLKNFVVSGPLPDTLFCAVQLRSGVRVKGGSSANIVGNRITEIRSASPLLRGCQNGFAIAVGRTFDVPVPGQVGQASIVGNTLDRYQKGGIYADNAGTSVTILNNTLIGDGPTNVIAQNGIQISRNATAIVRDNSIREHAYYPPVLPCVPDATCVTAAAILVFETNNAVKVTHNDLRRNQDGVGIYTAEQNTVSDNTIIGGIASSEIPGSTFGDGIYAGIDTAANRIENNFLRNNIEHDCHDDSVGPNNSPALVANFWIDNDGVTENRPGLCRGAHGDDDNDAEDDEDGDDDDHAHHPHHGHNYGDHDHDHSNDD